MDQSYGPFQSAVRTNLQLIIDELIAADKPMTLLPWMVGLVVFGGEDPETGLIVGSAFQHGFSHARNIKAWEKVGAVPLSRSCLQSPKVRRSIGDGNDDQQVLVHLIIEHNVITCNALLLVGYNGNVMEITLKPVKRTTIVTAPHMQDWIKLLSKTKTHGNIFAATGGIHLTANNIFKGIALKQHKLTRKKLTKEKTVHEHHKKIEMNVMMIQVAKGKDVTKLTSSNLTVHLTWHQHAKVATMKKDEKLAAWVAIDSSGREPPSFERWTDADNAKLLEAQSDVVEMAHTALGHLEELKKKELTLAAMTMSQEEFDQLVEQRNALIAESAVVSGNNHPNPSAPTMTTGDNASADTSGEGRGVVGCVDGV
jgi:hypothetical protein